MTVHDVDPVMAEQLNDLGNTSRVRRAADLKGRRLEPQASELGVQPRVGIRGTEWDDLVPAPAQLPGELKHHALGPTGLAALAQQRYSQPTLATRRGDGP
jgi:hypothetical protein